MNNKACCYVTCNCQSKLLFHAHLDECVKALSWKIQYLIMPVTVSLLPWPTSRLRYSFCSFFNNGFFHRWDLRLFCVLTKNGGPQGKVLLDSPYLLTMLLVIKYNDIWAPWHPLRKWFFQEYDGILQEYHGIFYKNSTRFHNILEKILTSISSWENIRQKQIEGQKDHSHRTWEIYIEWLPKVYKWQPSQ